MNEGYEKKIDRLERELAEGAWDYVQLQAAYDQLRKKVKMLEEQLDNNVVKTS